MPRKPKKRKRIIIAVPAEDVEYVEALRIYNVKIPDYYIVEKST